MNNSNLKFILLAGVIIIIYVAFVIILPVAYAGNFYKTESPENKTQEIFSMNKQVLNEPNNYLKVAVIGDSTAIGRGGDTIENSYSWQYLKKIKTDKYFKVEYSNFAKSGSSIKDVLDNQADKVIKQKYDLIFISIGANDVTDYKSNVKDYAAKINLLAEKLVKTNSKVVWLSIPDFITSPILLPPLNYILSGRAKEYNQQTEKILNKNNLKLIDVYDQTRAKFAEDSNKYFSKDKYHPSKDGYQLWAEAIHKVFPEI